MFTSICMAIAVLWDPIGSFKLIIASKIRVASLHTYKRKQQRNQQSDNNNNN